MGAGRSGEAEATAAPPGAKRLASGGWPVLLAESGEGIFLASPTWRGCVCLSVDFAGCRSVWNVEWRCGLGFGLSIEWE